MNHQRMTRIPCRHAPECQFTVVVNHRNRIPDDDLCWLHERIADRYVYPTQPWRRTRPHEMHRQSPGIAQHLANQLNQAVALQD